MRHERVRWSLKWACSRALERAARTGPNEKRFLRSARDRAASVLGLNEAPRNLRVAAWNCLSRTTFQDRPRGGWNWYFESVWDFLHWPVDDVPDFHAYAIREIKKYVLEDSNWHQFLDVVQYAAALGTGEDSQEERERFEVWNLILCDEGCAYRFVEGQLVPLTTPEEAEAVGSAIASPLMSVSDHVATALRMPSARPTPDTRNAIKESISAVEAALKVTTGREKGDLRDALPPFDSKFGELHGAFRGAIEKLYACTSDEKGVRHSLLEDSAKVDVDDARFMIIACSALSKFLVARATARDWQPQAPAHE